MAVHDHQLADNDRAPFNFIDHGDFELEMACTKWTRKKSPIIEETFYFENSQSGKHIKLVKAILCDPVNETDPDIKKHLVLFVQEVSSPPASTSLTQHITMNMGFRDEYRKVVVRYFLNENMPGEDQIDCALYKEIVESDNYHNVVGIIPDTNNGGIIIKV